MAGEAPPPDPGPGRGGMLSSARSSGELTPVDGDDKDKSDALEFDWEFGAHQPLRTECMLAIETFLRPGADKELALDREVVEVTVPVRLWPKRRGFSSPSVSEEDAVLEVGGDASPELPPYTRA